MNIFRKNLRFYRRRIKQLINWLNKTETIYDLFTRYVLLEENLTDLEVEIIIEVAEEILVSITDKEIKDMLDNQIICCKEKVIDKLFFKKNCKIVIKMDSKNIKLFLLNLEIIYDMVNKKII